MGNGWMDGWMASSENIEWEADALITENTRISQMSVEIFDEDQH